jgi:hypothetical protein
MLADLPLELLDMVIGEVIQHALLAYSTCLSLKIPSRGDLKRLCEVCKHLHDVAIPHLYRSLVLSAPELSLHDLVPILGSVPRKHLEYTAELGFSAPIHERVESRCVYDGDNGRFDTEAVQVGLPGSFTDDESMDGEDIDGNTAKVRKDLHFIRV